MTRILRTLAIGALLAAPLAAQDPVIATRMSSAKGDGSPIEPACKRTLSPGHYLVSSGATYLQTAMKTSQPDNRGRALRDGQRVLLQAITQSGQGSNPAAWYYLGRIDLMLGSVGGADSSLAKATAMLPSCAAEVDLVRGEAVRLLAIPANDFQSAGKLDSAMYLYRAASRIDSTKPFVNYQMAEIFRGQKQDDSALVYYERAITFAKDSTPVNKQIRGNAGYTAGSMYYNAQRYADAVRAFRVAVDANPNDQDAIKNLSVAFRAAGMPDSARALDDQLLKQAQASGTVTPDQLFDLGVAQFNDKKYADAAATFRKVLAADPTRHDALENLANSYFALDSTSALIAAAEQLVALEPLNYGGMKLLANGYKKAEDKQKQKPKTFEAFNRLLGMTVSLESVAFTPTDSGATLKLSAVGRPGADVRGNPLKSAAVPIVVEFLDGSGAVVASQAAVAPALAPDASQEVTVSASGKGIKGWRYRKT
ncbi:MAG TPA: tetratricopeptide repeat protein [Gemmatimonadales bacterium]|nr:tetratricopeptide repeat protein [Gemmatimonadales bacterium]